MDDDMISKISDMLSDPNAADKIRQAASSFLGSGSDDASQSASSGLDIQKLTSTISEASVKNSREINLLRAIVPYLRKSRADKVSSAIKAIQVISVLSALR